MIKHAVEAGINFHDTANVYSDRHSEEILGHALAECVRRDDVVIATKVPFPTGPGPKRHGPSRKAIFTEVDASRAGSAPTSIRTRSCRRPEHSVGGNTASRRATP